jgi:outer membrane protein assembly factor BamA
MDKRNALWLFILCWLNLFLNTYAQERNKETVETPIPVKETVETPIPVEETFGVPIPVVGIDPNEGSTLGVILAVVSENDGRLSSIVAPVATTNKLLGYSFDLNYFGFPSPDVTYQLFFSHTTENFWEYSAEYHNHHCIQDFLAFSGKFSFKRRPSSRFYGIGQNSKEDNETNYTLREVEGSAMFKAEMLKNVYASITLMGKRSWLRPGTMEDVASLEEKFPDVQGIDSDYSLPMEFAVEYDTRNSKLTPTAGLDIRAFFRIADESFLSSFNLRRYGAMGKIYIPLDSDAQFVTAGRCVVEYLEGDNIPFYEMSSLGGGNTLRGFGEGRFYDKHRMLYNVEERIRCLRFAVGEISLDIETTLFVDIGQVFNSFRKFDYRDFEVVFGAGLRMVVREQIVAKVDIGYGSEGSAIYAGLHYPF